METIRHPKEVKAQKQYQCDYCRGVIERGTIYIKSTHKYDEIYDWRSHPNCSEIASKLKMFDNHDEGVTGEDFREHIADEYSNIMSENESELWESSSFKVPSFQDRMQYVLKHHGLITPTSNAHEISTPNNNQQKLILIGLKEIWRLEGSNLSFCEWLNVPK